MKHGTDCSFISSHISKNPQDHLIKFEVTVYFGVMSWGHENRAVCEEELKAFIVLLYLSGIGSTNMATEGWESDKSEQNFRKHIRYMLYVRRGIKCVIHSTELIRYAPKCDVKQVLSILVIFLL